MASALVKALQRALGVLEIHPVIRSPALGRAIGIDGLRTWPVDGFPLTFWYFECEDCVDVARLVGQRQDALRIDLDEAPTGPTPSPCVLAGRGRAGG